MKLRHTLLEMLDELPPALCVLIARRDRKRIPVEEIKRQSGLSRRTWAEMMATKSYRNLTVSEVDAFRAACGINPLNEHLHRAYVIRTYSGKRPLRHLRKAT